MLQRRQLCPPTPTPTPLSHTERHFFPKYSSRLGPKAGGQNPSELPKVKPFIKSEAFYTLLMQEAQ